MLEKHTLKFKQKEDGGIQVKVSSHCPFREMNGYISIERNFTALLVSVEIIADRKIRN